MRLPFLPGGGKRQQRHRVNVQAVHVDTKTGERHYDLLPQSYLGPWYLPPGTVLEVVKRGPGMTPKRLDAPPDSLALASDHAAALKRTRT